MKSEGSKKCEGLAKKVLDILLNDYARREEIGTNLEDGEYLSVIEWSILDYESCGFKMDGYKSYVQILKKQYLAKINKLKERN